MKIAILTGHYAEHKGIEKNNLVEFDECKKITDLLTKKLESAGHTVIAKDGQLIDKIHFLNLESPDLAIEVHLGNSNNTNLRGTRCLHSGRNPLAKKAAEVLVREVSTTLATLNNGAHVGWYKNIRPEMVRQGRFGDWKAKVDLLLSKTTCPTIILEPVYISSESDCQLYLVSGKHDIISEAVFKGVQKALEAIKDEQASMQVDPSEDTAELVVNKTNH